jgi:DNA segregation ATPase FtsK/SpoIIIE, S-DNA-T family
MAKKKKSNRKKKIEEVEKSTFWPLAAAIIMMLTAVFILLGGFSAGGPLPEALFGGIFWAFGWTAYVVPFLLLFLAVLKFTNEEGRIPLNKLMSILAFMVLLSSWFHVGFGSQDGLGAVTDGRGGEVGALVGNITLNAITKLPASVMFFVLSVLAFFLSFNISPKIILEFFDRFKKDEQDTDLAELKEKAPTFTLNEGVPIERGSNNARHSTMKNTANSLSGAENHEALTLASDPDWKLPGIGLLNQKQDTADPGDVDENAAQIKESLSNFNIKVQMEGASVGPRVTQYTLRPPAGIKLTKIKALEDNLALDLAAQTIRIEAPIPGKRAVGIEVPNVKPASVRISGIFQSDGWQKVNSPLAIAVGKDISGSSIVADLDTMPHLLVAGQTGSGKSVMINSILTSLLYRNSPSDLKLILVDPKRVELKPYDGIPHLLAPVITEPEKCISALKWTVAEMERRYRALAEAGNRNIAEYNASKKEEGMPYIVIVIDELSDLMMMAARDVESLIVRIAQKARAVGIHLILATQRPSVDVITGLIKANVPARIAFTTASQVDSRTIIDQIGAEKLLGRGDMLYLNSDMPKPKRLQGALITDEETAKVTEFIRQQRDPSYDDEVISQPVQIGSNGGVVVEHGGGSEDKKWADAVREVIQSRKASTSYLQRRLKLGYGRAASLIDAMEEQGIIGPADGNRPREVLAKDVESALGNGGGDSDQSQDVYDEIPLDDEQK